MDPVALTEFDFEALDAATASAGRFGSDPAAVLEATAVAREEAEALREQARAEGFAAGHAEALAAARPAVAALAAALVDAQRAAVATADRLEAEALELALAVAGKVVGATLAVRPELILDVVRTALRGIAERERITVLVHPDDLPLLTSAVDALRMELGGIEHFEVQAERRVARGGAIVRHLEGEVDARVDTRLERVREVVAEALAEAS